jgi:hypothetical protein
MAEVDTTGWVMCPTCRYPFPGSCENPACVENPSLTPAIRQRLLDNAEAYRLAELERHQRQELYARSLRRDT